MTEKIRTLEKPLEDWRRLLSADQYAVLFKAATEPPGSSPLNQEKRVGLFVCAACYLPLFESSSKYESGTGWPSFFAPIADRVGTTRDFKMILPRTEYHCLRCGDLELMVVAHFFPRDNLPHPIDVAGYEMATQPPARPSEPTKSSFERPF